MKSQSTQVKVAKSKMAASILFCGCNLFAEERKLCTLYWAITNLLMNKFRQMANLHEGRMLQAVLTQV